MVFLPCVIYWDLVQQNFLNLYMQNLKLYYLGIYL